MIPAAMLAHRIMGIMAHWREYMGKENIYLWLNNLADGLSIVTHGKLFRPTHLYTGHAAPTSDPRPKI